MDYNPFDKDISLVRRTDLDKLFNKEVAEGFYVEYKETFPSDNLKIAHSLASFANSEGGWYIIGVQDNKDNVATTICGFDLTMHRKPKEKIRDIIHGHINPKPLFTSKLIMLPNNKAVLIVCIERGNETPYVTSDGKIYRRIGEGANPVSLSSLLCK